MSRRTGGLIEVVAGISIFIVFLLLATQPALAGDAIHGRVVGVNDGDTLTLVDAGNQQHKIRLAEIDAPESKQAFGQVSKKSLSDMCFGKEATATVIDRDRYKRSVARMDCAGIDANLEQVRRGLAWAYVRYARNPRIFAAEKEARAAGRGLWTEKDPVAPWEWRRK